MNSYHVQLDESTRLPMSAESIREAWRRGQIKAGTLIWREGLEGWQTAHALSDELQLPQQSGGFKPQPSAKVHAAAVQAPKGSDSNKATESSQGLEMFLLIGGVLTAGYFLFFYSTVNDTVHNLGLLQNRALGAATGGTMVIISVLIAGFNRRAGRVFAAAISTMIIAFVALLLAGIIYTVLKKSGAK